MHNDMYVRMLTQNFTIIDNCYEKCLNILKCRTIIAITSHTWVHT